MSEYRTVLWDIGGVIVELESIRQGYSRFIEDLATEHGLDPDSALERWKTVLGDHFRGRDAPRYRLAREGYAKATAELFDGDPPTGWETRLESAVTESIRHEPGSIETIERLDEAGYKQAIVSDIDTPEAHRILDTFGVRERFDHITTSEAVGYTKPDERMFEDALDALEADPSHTLVVGDRHTHDIVGAAALDIDPVGYGPDAKGPETKYEIEDLRDLLTIVDRND